MAKVKRPESIKLGSHTWTIEFDEHELVRTSRLDGTDKHGICLHSEHRIIIEDRRPLTAMQETLVHEILHACVWTGRILFVIADCKEEDDSVEERVVASLSGILLDALKENPEVFAWIYTDEEIA